MIYMADCTLMRSQRRRFNLFYFFFSVVALCYISFVYIYIYLSYFVLFNCSVLQLVLSELEDKCLSYAFIMNNKVFLN